MPGPETVNLLILAITLMLISSIAKNMKPKRICYLDKVDK
jgi:hypothetical protein